MDRRMGYLVGFRPYHTGLGRLYGEDVMILLLFWGRDE